MARLLPQPSAGRCPQAGHDAGQVPGADVRGVLVEGAVADVVQLVLNAPVAADPGCGLVAAGRTGRQAGDQVDPLDRQLSRAKIASPAHDLEGLAGVRVVEVSEGGGLQASDLVAVTGPGALDVVEADVAPGQAAEALMQSGVVPLHDGQVVRSSFVQVGGVVVLGVQGVRRDDGVGQVDAVQERGEGRDLVAPAVDLSLRKDLAAVGHRGDQCGGRPAGGAGTAEGLAIDGDDLPFRVRGLACPEEVANGAVEGVAVRSGEDEADGGGMGRADQSGGGTSRPEAGGGSGRDPSRARTCWGAVRWGYLPAGGWGRVGAGSEQGQDVLGGRRRSTRRSP